MGHYYLGSLTMNTMGYVSLLLALCLLSTSAAPAPILDPVSIAFSAAAGGLTLTAGTSAITIPTSTLLLGKAIGIKGLVLNHLATNQQNRETPEQQYYNSFSPSISYF